MNELNLKIMVDTKKPQSELSQKAEIFKSTLGNDVLVKNITTNETKNLNLTGKISIYNNRKLRSTINDIIDNRAKPKANYAKVDERLVSIFRHGDK